MYGRTAAELPLYEHNDIMLTQHNHLGCVQHRVCLAIAATIRPRVLVDNSVDCQVGAAQRVAAPRLLRWRDISASCILPY